jgi:hypothetical protein
MRARQEGPSEVADTCLYGRHVLVALQRPSVKLTRRSHMLLTYLPEPIVARLVPEDQHQADNNRQTRYDAVWKTNVIVTDIVEVDDERRPQRAQDDRDCNVDMDCPFDESQHQRPSAWLMP